MSQVTVGVIGAGWVARDRYLPVLSRMAGVAILGVADRNEGRAQVAAAKYHARAFRSAGELLNESPQVVFVCTSPFSHASLAEEAMVSGANVFVEKPMAVGLTEAERMVAVAESTRKTLGVSHNLLFSRSVRKALDRLDSGKHGELLHVLAIQSTSPRRRLPHWYSDLPGGLFYDEAPHMLYLIDRVAGSLEVVDAWSQKRSGSDQFSAIGADFIGQTGVRATMRMLFEAPVSEWILTLVMREGVSVVDLFRDIEVFIPPDGRHGPWDILKTSARSIVGHTMGTAATGARYMRGRQFWGHDLLIRDYLRALADGRDPAVTGSDGLRVTRSLAEVLDLAQDMRDPGRPGANR